MDKIETSSAAPTSDRAFNQHWADDTGHHLGGVSSGLGFTISWQRGASAAGRNGALPVEVLRSVHDRLTYCQQGESECLENRIALTAIAHAIAALDARRDRRNAEASQPPT